MLHAALLEGTLTWSGRECLWVGTGHDLECIENPIDLLVVVVVIVISVRLEGLRVGVGDDAAVVVAPRIPTGQ